MASKDNGNDYEKIKKHINEARRHMKALNIYKKEFDPVIGIYAEMRVQNENITQKFMETGYKFEVSTPTGTKKAPIVTTLESLRKDILSYASQLGLTPQGLLKTDAGAFATKKNSVLDDLLKGG